MFDGNYRATRRNINLSGQRQPRTSRPSGANNNSTSPLSVALRPAVGEGIEDRKRQVLESTRILREERRHQQRKEESAKQIQRFYRGWGTRRQLVGQTWNALYQQQQQHQQPVTNADSQQCPHPPVGLLLSLLLSPPLFGVWKRQANQENQLRQVLLQYVPSLNDSSITSQRILQAMLHELRPQPHVLVDTDFLSRLLQQAQAILQIPPEPLADNNLGRALVAKPRVTEQVYLTLMTCARDWLWHTTATTNNNSDSHQRDEMVCALWTLACQVRVDPALAQQQHALVATVLLGWKTSFFRQQDQLTSLVTRQMIMLLQPGQIDTDDNNHKWVQQLVAVMTDIQPLLSDTNQKSLLMSAIAENLERRQNIVLSNVLELWSDNGIADSPSNMVRFIHYIFAQRPDLTLLSSLVASGFDKDSLRALVGLATPSPKNMATAMDTTNEEDDDDDISLEDGDDGLVRAPNVNAETAVSRQQKSSTSRTAQQQQRLTRQEVQTLPKLDGLYQQQIQRWRQQVITECKAAATSQKAKDGLDPLAQLELMVDVALQMGSGSLWLEWGLALFSANSKGGSTATASSMVTDDDVDDDVDQSQELYLRCLFTLLQASTSLRPSTSVPSPLLSQLAFSRDFLERLWHHFVSFQRERTAASDENGGWNTGELNQRRQQRRQESFWCTANVTCHVFSHYLMAISDDEFLQNHTSQMNNRFDNVSNDEVVILAEDGIAHLRTLLHELYWSRPVVAKDFQVPYLAERDSNRDSPYLKSLRACALLAGTKLWNSLYERWCRLVRVAPFCSESTWWFPRLVGDGSVVNHQSTPHHRHHQDTDDDDVDPMDIDESSEEGEINEAQVAMDAENEELAGAFRDPKMARILTSIPQALPFDRRVKMFHSLLVNDKLKTQDEDREFRRAVDRMIMMRGEGEENAWAPREVVSIHRDNMYEDSMDQLNKLGPRLKQKVQVTFINQHGTQEAGIDGGGVFKEFLDDLIKDAFVGDGSKSTKADTIPRLFSVTPQQTLTVNPQLTQDLNMLPHYEFLGRVLGKAVYESILVEPQFCLPFLNKLLGKPNYLEDLKNYDTEYYKNLTKLRKLKDDEFKNLGLVFELSVGPRTIELVRDGRTTAVTKENVSQYVHLVAHHLLNVQGAPQTRAFLRGFRDLIPASWVRLFSSYELQKLIGGDDSVRGIDVTSLKQSMQYSAGYHESQPIIEWFWEVVSEFSPDQQRKLLKFMTSCSRQPLLGFGSLEPAPCIQQIRLPENIFRGDAETIAKKTPLPTSSTCMNLLKLPNYREKDLLRKKLLDAIEAGAGFELT